MSSIQVGFPPFLTIVSRLNQVTNQPFRQRESQLFHHVDVSCLVVSSQTTVLRVLEILIDWFEEHAFVPQLVSSASVLDFMKVATQRLTFPTNYETMRISWSFCFLVLDAGPLVLFVVSLPGKASAAWSPLLHSTVGQEVCSAPQHTGKSLRTPCKPLSKGFTSFDSWFVPFFLIGEWEGWNTTCPQPAHLPGCQVFSSY